MPKQYVTFRQVHVHSINGKTFDKDCVAVFDAHSDSEGRRLAFDFFGPKFCMHYSQERWNEEDLLFYPRGYIEVDSCRITNEHLNGEQK